ncbi:Ldh family oxidoreductase, partial [Chloroflexota bacterium]
GIQQVTGDAGEYTLANNKRGNPMAANVETFDPKKLNDFAVRALMKVGVPEDDAKITADILIATDLRGIDSHGIAHLGMYTGGLKEGRTNPNPNTQIISQAPATAIMEGDKGLGFVVGYRAMTEAMRRAEETGAGFVTVRNSSHFGAGGNYAMMALPRDMIGISMTEGGKGMNAPGTVGRGIHINVISVAIPAKDEAPFVLDMATTVVAAGKIEIANREGKQLPEGWSIDKDGNPITDPKKHGTEGALLPLGGTPQTGVYKGFGLALVVDILTGVLSGAPQDTLMAGNHFFGALKIDGFMPVDNFKKLLDAKMQEYKSLPKAPGIERIFLPGEIEQEIEENRQSGIPLHPAVVESLKKVAADLDIEYDL